MPSKRKATQLVDRDGIRGGTGYKDKEVALVEIDATLAATLGIQDGQRVMVSIHVDPPLAHTVNIEPLTPEDWEMIELHATFLELNMLSQIRALPNPAWHPESGADPTPHPLTLHLSPTSTANIKVVSFEPAQPADMPFAKIAPDAEVIVAPKTRPKISRSSRDSKSVASTSRKSGKSSTSTVRNRSRREERKPALFLRGISRECCDEWFPDDMADEDLRIWVDGDILFTKPFQGLKFVTVSMVRPAGLEEPIDPQKQKPESQGPKPAEKVTARLLAWDEPPNGQVAALSGSLCAALCCQGVVGGVIKLEPAPEQLLRKSIDSEGISRETIQRLKYFPFTSSDSPSSMGLKIGGESKAEREEAARRIQQIYGDSLLSGPVTDGQVLGVPDSMDGGILKFDPPLPSSSQSSSKDVVQWILGSGWHLPIEVQAPIPRPTTAPDTETRLELHAGESSLVGIDLLLEELQSHISHMSSVLLTGGLGSGKTSVAKEIANRLRQDELYHTTYFPCTRLVNDESRVSTIKETLMRLFMEANWGARLGGKSLVILDDLDKLCPAETELQVGNENGRSRQISEAVSSIVRQYCGRGQSIVFLATCQSKDSLHNVLIGGHVVREIVDLKAPDKQARREIMEHMTREDSITATEPVHSPVYGSRPTTADGSAVMEDTDAWMDSSSETRRRKSPSLATGFIIESGLDFLDIAGQIDGYMPGDIKSLVARARNEALIRAVGNTQPGLDLPISLGPDDFAKAVEGFTPASLRNVTLQSSTTTFDSIGGLTETRRVLLETLQYPTKYAPIFAQCPLRLRSGLLLYGYPGCGKTLLASAVAGECGLNFISVKGPEILNKYIGASEKSVRDLFERAQAAKPCVLFFDEFDSIAPKRGHDSTGVTDRVVNQLLTQMDGAEGLSGVYVLAATSRPDLIDPALLRPGRLDKSLLCDFPDPEDRIDILKALAKKVKVSDDVLNSEEAVNELARRTEGFSGADLQALISNAQLQAIHDVLNDHEAEDGVADSHGRKPRFSKTGSGSARNFVQFRYGVDESKAEAEYRTKSGMSRNSALAEQAAIAAKLESIRLARKGARHQAQVGHELANGKASQPTKEVFISWKHLVAALNETRASISSDERRRLERIYREFVVGRSGEMRDGQGSMEIGGRSSLM
jgi:peroxin-1